MLQNYTYRCNIKKMKQRELKQAFTAAGWWLLREGANHEIWTNGQETEPLPRHREIPEPLAKKILKKVRAYPGKRS